MEKIAELDRKKNEEEVGRKAQEESLALENKDSAGPFKINPKE